MCSKCGLTINQTAVYKQTFKTNTYSKQHENELMRKLETLYCEDKNEFWKVLKSLKNNIKEEELPTIENLTEHFKKLFTVKTDDTQTEKQFNGEHLKTFDSLNNEISQEEVEKTIKNLKSKKSTRIRSHYKRDVKMYQCTRNKADHHTFLRP